MKKKIYKTYQWFLAVFMLSVTTFCALPASAFEIGGWNVGMDGVHKVQSSEDILQKAREKSNEKASTGIDQAETAIETGQQNHAQAQERVREIIETKEVLRMVNRDKNSVMMLKDFSGDDICIQTETRKVCVRVLDDGQIAELDRVPAKYHRLKTNEDFINRMHEKAEEGRYMKWDEITKNVQVPFRMKMKVALSHFFG